jgi:hypothetical protein
MTRCKRHSALFTDCLKKRIIISKLEINHILTVSVVASTQHGPEQSRLCCSHPHRPQEGERTHNRIQYLRGMIGMASVSTWATQYWSGVDTNVRYLQAHVRAWLILVFDYGFAGFVWWMPGRSPMGVHTPASLFTAQAQPIFTHVPSAYCWVEEQTHHSRSFLKQDQ